MKKFLAIFLSALMLFAYTSCGIDESDNGGSQQESTKSDEQVIYTDEHIKVTYIKVADAKDVAGVDLTTCYVYLKCENVSSHTYTVSLTEAYANDSAVTMMTAVPITLSAGKNSNQPFMFGYNNILSSTDDLTKLDFKIMLLDESAKVIETTDNITINIK